MIIWTSLCYPLTLILLFSCGPKTEYFEDAICINNINTIDPQEGLKAAQTIVIKDGKIHKIFDTNTIALATDNTIIDGTDKFLIPGLWDTHVHFSYTESLAPSMFNLFLGYGITSVRDTGGNVDFVKSWKDKALKQPTDAPRVMMAGPLLDGIPTVYDGSDSRHPELGVGLSSLEEIRNQINLLHSKNVDLLKAYEMLSPEQFKEITKLARTKGLKVTGHVPLSMDVISASNAGLNSMEHMRNLELSCATNSEELLAQRITMLLEGKNSPGGALRSKIHKAQKEMAIANYDDSKADQVLAVLRENDTWQIPTLALNTFFTGRYFERPEWQESYSYLPDTLGDYWKTRSQVLSKMEPSAFRKTYDAWSHKMIKKIHDAKIPIMAGTDTPIAYLTPGLSLHEELSVLVEAGLSNLEALKTATLNPAIYFNLESSLGSIKENMLADLVILDANPLLDINNTKRISAVIKEGKYRSREDLDRLFNELANQ